MREFLGVLGLLNDGECFLESSGGRLNAWFVLKRAEIVLYELHFSLDFRERFQGLWRQLHVSIRAGIVVFIY